MIDEELPRCANEGCLATLAEDGTCHVCDQGLLHDPRRGWEVFVASRPTAVQEVIREYGMTYLNLRFFRISAKNPLAVHVYFGRGNSSSHTFGGVVDVSCGTW